MIDCRHFAVSILASFVLVTSEAQALSPEATTEQVRVRLVAEADAVVSGETITLGLQQRIIPNWHTYWINPGDSGLPTTIAWRLPAGASAGEIQWPAPNRYAIGPITNYGYADEVTLLTDIAVPANAQVGGTFPIIADVEWLVCEEICIPQQAQLGLELPIVASADQAGDGARYGSDSIAAARARLPVTSPWPVSVVYRDDRIELRVHSFAAHANTIEDAWFFADTWGRTVHAAEQLRRIEGDALVLEIQAGEAPPQGDEPMQGVLVLTERTGDETIARGFAIAARPTVGSPLSGSVATLSVPVALLFAFLGGLILNLMPCVFPVLSIKALSFLSHADRSPAQRRLHGGVYTLGVLATFTLLAAALLALRAGGAQIGWGFQFQSPLFVVLIAYLMFAVGLSLSGVFHVGGSIAGVGSSLAGRSGYAGSFFTGVLAVVVASPCTAPFMGAAMGFALVQPSAVLFAVFASLGLGLAAPYLLLTLWPGLQRALPKPGAWMERMKQALAFPMYATAAWLVWVLAQQAGSNAVAVALSGMLSIAFAAWLYSSTRDSASMARHVGGGVAALSVAAALFGSYVGVNSASPSVATSSQPRSEANWEPYGTARLQALQAQGAPVFVNMTAAWCITCLVNEQVALSDATVLDAFAQSNIVYLKGDWTQRDAEITAMLNRFGRSGVPLYVFYPAGGGEPVVLPQLLTPQIVLSAINPASRS